MINAANQLRIGFLHTTPKSISMVDSLTAEYLPGARAVNFLDDVVKLYNFSAPIGKTPRENCLRFANYAKYLEQEGCSMIVSCCSLMPVATEYAQKVLSIPIIQMDAPALDKAVETSARIGIIGTVDRAVPFMKNQIEQKAQILGKKIEIDYSLNSKAFEYFSKNDMDTHDQLVLDDIKKMDDKNVDCILFAQVPLGLLEDRALALGLRKPLYCAGRQTFEWIKSTLGK